MELLELTIELGLILDVAKRAIADLVGWVEARNPTTIETILFHPNQRIKNQRRTPPVRIVNTTIASMKTVKETTVKLGSACHCGNLLNLT